MQGGAPHEDPLHGFPRVLSRPPSPPCPQAWSNSHSIDEEAEAVRGGSNQPRSPTKWGRTRTQELSASLSDCPQGWHVYYPPILCLGLKDGGLVR